MTKNSRPVKEALIKGLDKKILLFLVVTEGAKTERGRGAGCMKKTTKNYPLLIFPACTPLPPSPLPC